MKFFAALLPLCALTVACAEPLEGDESQVVSIDKNDTELLYDIVADSEHAERGCQVVCKKCPPNKLCTQECELVGQCTNQCTTIALCVEGYSWDDQSCQCLPENTGGQGGGNPNQAGEPCGDTQCAGGTVCCNASCGICTQPDEYCIQIACE